MTVGELRSAFRRSSRAFPEAFISCATMMVQGNFLAFTFAHAGVAATTAFYSFFGVLIMLIIWPTCGKWGRIWGVGIFTCFADMLIHPSHFGDASTEAIMTGIGAFILAMLFSRIFPNAEEE